MGTWGVMAFDNDTAADWSYELEAADDLSVIEGTLSRVLMVGRDYLDADLACEGLAACEVVARLNGRWGPRTSNTEAADQWVEAHPLLDSRSLLPQAVAVTDRVLTPPSELLELWEESGIDEWRSGIEELRSRLAN